MIQSVWVLMLNALRNPNLRVSYFIVMMRLSRYGSGCFIDSQPLFMVVWCSLVICMMFLHDHGFWNMGYGRCKLGFRYPMFCFIGSALFATYVELIDALFVVAMVVVL